MSDDLADHIEGFDNFYRRSGPRIRTSSDWLAAVHPEPCLILLRSDGVDRTPGGRRKLRLFACACCRHVWHLIAPHEPIAACVEFAERYADNDGAKARLKKMIDANEAWVSRSRGRPHMNLIVAQVAAAARGTCVADAGNAAWMYNSFGEHSGGDPATDYPTYAILLRCIFGNPFRPVTFDPSWRSETAVLLARGIYNDRAFDRLPILADALEEAGCDNADVLTHCRDPNGHHARGCWVVDGVLGKG